MPTEACPCQGPLPSSRPSMPAPDQAHAWLHGRPAELLLCPALGLLTSPTVMLLELANQFLSVASDLVPLVIGELAPLLAQLAFELGPLPFDNVPVHGHGCPPFRHHDN